MQTVPSLSETSPYKSSPHRSLPANTRLTDPPGLHCLTPQSASSRFLPNLKPSHTSIYCHTKVKHQEGRGFDSGSLLNPRNLEQELVNTKLPKFCGGKQLSFIIILPTRAQLLSENPSLVHTRYLDIMLSL